MPDGTSTSTDRPTAKAGAVGMVASVAPEAESAVDARRLAALQSELRQKDIIVERLTEQLELAAEQLDRLQRSGGERRRGTGALPAEVVEDHKTLLGDLQRVVQQWEDLQAGLALGRIEVQLTELREFVSDRLTGPVGTHAVADGKGSDGFAAAHHYGLPTVITSNGPDVDEEPTRFHSARPEHHDHSRHSADEAVEPHSSGGTSTWDQLKSQMLSGEAAPDESLPPPTLPTVPAAPAAVPFDTASRADLIAAITIRDDYSLALLHRLRVVEDANFAQAWQEAATSAPDVASHLQALSQRMEAALRLSEVELSMERAKLARDQARVALQQQAIDKQLKELGLSSAEQASGRRALSAPDRRWVRFLGGRKET